VTPVAILAVALLAQPPAVHSIDLPAGTTADGVNRLAAQAGVDVVVTIDLSDRRSPAVRGRMDVDTAFQRLLRPAGARAVRLADRLYRIEAIPRRAAQRPLVTPAPRPVELEEVIVTAPVRRGGLDGANGRSTIDDDALARSQGAASSEALSDLSATVDSTRQGPGRNKLFIRGMADSAFNGPLQATVGQYLGDLRLNYGSPDPDLELIDIQRIDVFEGPQGSRFGAGSIGGVVRIQPTPPELGRTSGLISAGASATSGGAPGGDAAVVLNQPLGQTSALRLVAYGRREGGFLDNPVRGVDDADHVDARGLRLSVRTLHDGWTVDGMALVQRISADDAQTVSVAAQAPVKDRAVAEPYDSTLTLLGLSAHRRFTGGRFTGSASLSRQTLDERFDATQPPGDAPEVVDRRQTVTALSLEARFETDPGDFWSWNGGAALAVGRTDAPRERTPLFDGEPAYGVDVRRRFAEAALFAEAIASPAPDLDLAFGGRLLLARAEHNLAPIGRYQLTGGAAPDRTEAVFSPTAAIRWTPPGGPLVFARLERGIRPGSVSESDGALQRFRSDRVTLLEAGLRSRDLQDWTLEASIGWIDWRDVQADMVTQGGDLVTGNAGDGTIRFLQAKAAWAPTSSLSFSGGLFLNDSRLTLSGPSIIGVSGGDIPNVARTGAQFSAAWEPGRLLDRPLRLAADLRYIGRSRPGLGVGLDTLQGGYLKTDLSARWGDDRRALLLRVSNPLDEWAIRYGVGSPYQLGAPQGAPLRPLTIRLGFETTF